MRSGLPYLHDVSRCDTIFDRHIYTVPISKDLIGCYNPFSSDHNLVSLNLIKFNDRTYSLKLTPKAVFSRNISRQFFCTLKVFATNLLSLEMSSLGFEPWPLFSGFLSEGC